MLTFIMQLEDDPADLHEHFLFVLRRLAPGPGGLFPVGDICNLDYFRFQLAS